MTFLASPLRLFFSFSRVFKTIGAASETEWSFDTVLELGQAIARVTLGHCHIPGRSEYSVIPLWKYRFGYQGSEGPKPEIDIYVGRNV